MRKVGALATLAGLIGAGLLGAFLLPASSQQATTITLYEKERSGFEKLINVDGKRKIAGDYIVGTHPLYRVGTQTVVGRDVETLLFVQSRGKHGAKSRFRAAATFTLARGKIEAAGSSTFANLANGAAFTITGGTRAYAGASGTLNVRSAEGRTFFTFTLNQ